MSAFTVKYNTFNAEEFCGLWQTVWGDPPAYEQVKLALDHTLFRVGIYDGSSIIAMARVIGDLGLCYYIKDVIVHPDYQGRGIGRMLIDEIQRYIEENGVPGTWIFTELAAVPDKAPFYEKFGFSANEAIRLRKMIQVPDRKQREP